MKTLKFVPDLVPLVLSGEKTTTWRLWDDKNLTVGERVSFLNSETGQEFAVVQLTKVYEKPFKDLTKEDWTGHEKFNSEAQMYQSYSLMYAREVSPSTLVKIIHYKLI